MRRSSAAEAVVAVTPGKPWARSVPEGRIPALAAQGPLGSPSLACVSPQKFTVAGLRYIVN